jgi:hypothetical protein
VGSTFFKLPGQNRHFEPLMQLLAFDPTMIPGFFGWSGGVEQGVEVVPNPSLTPAVSAFSTVSALLPARTK